MKARLLSGCFAVAIGLASAAAVAQSIDLTLDVEYLGRDPVAGGTWQLYVATDGAGLSSLDLPLFGVDSAITSELPVGRVNDSVSDNAGFSIFVDTPIGGDVTRLIAAQTAAVPGAGEQSLFYGFGTLESGSPDFVGRPPGTNTLGPTFTSLTNLQNSPWATSGEPSATAALVASGSFSAGSTPGFGSIDDAVGFVFTSVGNSTTPGADAQASAFSTLVLSNLEIGVGDGDYNLDGVVDAADYTVWRDTLGDSVTSLTGADGDGDGMITQADYDIWETNFGAASPAVSIAVPEPAAAASLAVLLALLGTSRPKKPEQTRAVA